MNRKLQWWSMLSVLLVLPLLTFGTTLRAENQLRPATPTSSAIEWNSGQKIYRVYLITSSEQVDQKANTQAAIPGPPRKKAPGMQVDRKTQMGDTPLFSDLPNGGGRIRSLPGGIIVTFKRPLAENEVASWAQEQQVQILRTLKIPGTYLIASDAGVPTLTLATTLAAHPWVQKVTPNWKTKVQHR